MISIFQGQVIERMVMTVNGIITICGRRGWFLINKQIATGH